MGRGIVSVFQSTLPYGQSGNEDGHEFFEFRNSFVMHSKSIFPPLVATVLFGYQISYAQKILETYPVIETPPVASQGDAADDPAFWLNVVDSSKSVIFGTDKEAGIYAYNLAGEQIQFVGVGRINNIDVRAGYLLDDIEVSILVGTNRNWNSIDFFSISNKGELVEYSGNRVVTDLVTIYGLCLFKDTENDKTYIFVSDEESLTIRQYLIESIFPARLSMVREIRTSSVSEGCVVDDSRGYLYFSQEDENNGVYKVLARPVESEVQTVDISKRYGGHLEGDSEGLAIVPSEKKGLLIVSSQGSDDFTVFERDGSNRYLGRFLIADYEAAGGSYIDGASDTDGIEVFLGDLPGPFVGGILIAQDGLNESRLGGKENQNFKLVPLKLILEHFQSVSP